MSMDSELFFRYIAWDGNQETLPDKKLPNINNMKEATVCSSKACRKGQPPLQTF